MGARIAVSISRTKLPAAYRRRVTFRNSRIRHNVSGYANYERLWFLGLDLTLQWGAFDRRRPDLTSKGGLR